MDVAKMRKRVDELEDLRDKVEKKGQYLARAKQAELTKLKHLLTSFDTIDKDLDGYGTRY